MVEPVDPGLAVRLSALDGPDVVRLAVVVPGDDLDDVDLGSRGDEVFPAGGVEVGVGVVYELWLIRR